MAKIKTPIPCVSCGNQINKNGHCEDCRREWADGSKKIVCIWCDEEVTDNELRGRGDEEGAPLFHLDCLVEREYIHEDIAYMNKFGGLLSLIFRDADKTRKCEEDKSEPPLVTGILAQMKATNWRLGSIIFNIDSDICEQKGSAPPGPPTTAIVRVSRNEEEEPSAVTETVNQMDSSEWKLSSFIFNITPDEKENKPPTSPSPTSRRQR